MSAFLAIFSLILVLFGGWGLGYLLFRSRQSVCDQAIHSWLIGAFYVSALLGLFGILLSGESLVAGVTLAMVIPGILALRKRLRTGAVSFAVPWPKGIWEWFLCAVLLVQCVILMHFASKAAIGWDGLMVWEVKARIAFANGGRMPVAYFSDTSRLWSHSNYPLMLPLLETWVYLSIGECNQYWLKPIFELFYLSALLLLYSGAAGISGRRWIGLLTASLLFFVPLLTVVDCNVFTGYADFPLATLYLAAVIYFIRYQRDPASCRPIVYAIYAAALPWMKQEGVILWLFLMLVAAFRFVHERKYRLIALTAIPGAVTIIAWKLAMRAVGDVSANDFFPVTLPNLVNHASRIGVILHSLLEELTAARYWSLLWWLFPVAVIWVAIRESRALALQLLAFVILPLGLYSCIYIFSSWPVYLDHIHTSLPRLVSDLSLVALLTIGISISAIARSFSRRE